MGKTSKAQLRAIKKYAKAHKKQLKEYRREYYLKHRKEPEQVWIPDKPDQMDLIRLEKFIIRDLETMGAKEIAEKYNIKVPTLFKFISERAQP